MSTSTRSVAWILGLALIALPLLTTAAGAQPANENGNEDATWRILTSVRRSLTDAGPTRATFTQTYIPAGFSSGDVERGTLALDLPDCLRWDYSEPYAKAFLLCGETAYLWNPEDPTGRRYTVDREREPGLDLVLLSVDELRERYRVESETDPKPISEDGSPQARVRVRLVPQDASGEIAEARLEVDRETDRVVSLSYTDDEGNETRFAIEGYRPLRENGIFSPPSGVEWTETEP